MERICQNLRFTATVPEDAEFAHPNGASLMRRLSADLPAAGWQTDEMDNWRDVGWSVVCHRGSSELEVIVSWVQRGYWMLQVKPYRVSGAIGRMFGSKPSASATEVHALALAVHHALSAARLLDEPRWRWDAFPDETHSAPLPEAA